MGKTTFWPLYSEWPKRAGANSARSIDEKLFFAVFPTVSMDTTLLHLIIIENVKKLIIDPPYCLLFCLPHQIRRSRLLGGSPVESLQSHFIFTMSHWSSGLTLCFPSQGTWVQISWGVLTWNWDSPVSVVFVGHSWREMLFELSHENTGLEALHFHGKAKQF